jgi:hypothetical protein
MKCLSCGVDSKLKERTDGKCKDCHKTFAFEPTSGDLFTDVAFQAMIDRVSSLGKVRWGKEHLYYEACRLLFKRKGGGGGCMLVTCILFTLGACISTSSMMPILALLACVLIVKFLKRPVLLRPLDEPTFTRHFEKWCVAHGTPKGLIERPPEGARPARRVSEADLADYSFDRAVICDRARTVDLLLANNFHFENNCAVLGVGGYPKMSFETVREMLRRNPRLQVFVLHDATPAGCNLAWKLANDPAWFKGRVRVIDVGLRPLNASFFKGSFIQAHQAVAPSKALSATEQGWLGQYALELAAIRPEQVIKRLFKAMQGYSVEIGRPHGTLAFSPESDSGDGQGQPGQLDMIGDSGEGDFGVVTDTSAFSADADASDGGGDSFG